MEVVMLQLVYSKNSHLYTCVNDLINGLKENNEKKIEKALVCTILVAVSNNISADQLLFILSRYGINGKRFRQTVTKRISLATVF